MVPAADVSLAKAAHDLQEPLRLLSGQLDLLCAHLDGKARIDGPKLAHDAKDTADRMQRLIANLLEYARVSHAPLRSDDVPLGVALEDALANLRLRLRETGGQVTHGPLPHVLGDRTQLSRAFQNVVENSLKYAHRAPVVHVTAREADGEWVVTIDDNGPGWPARDRDKLFEPFTRIASTSGVPGNGLGLATVRGILERHHGRVVALDAPGGGARIELRFPVVRA